MNKSTFTVARRACTGARSHRNRAQKRQLIFSESQTRKRSRIGVRDHRPVVDAEARGKVESTGRGTPGGGETRRVVAANPLGGKFTRAWLCVVGRRGIGV